MKITLSFFMMIIFATEMMAGTTYYVKTSGDDGAAGTSWGTAFATVQEALSTAASGDQIWVAAGTYTPSTSDQTATFTLKAGVAVYGGFAGTESFLSERDWQTNVTTLSGDIDNDGTLNGNSYHVVKAFFVNGATLNGFVVTGGANATDFGGGGIELLYATDTLSNLIITGNNSGSSSSLFGGGLYTAGSGGPVLTNVTFSGNQTAGNGGGMYNSGTVSLTNCTFTGNKAGYGGGFYNDGGTLTSFVNNIFRNDTATTFGGGFYNSGIAVTLQNILFDGDRATLGGGGAFSQNGNGSFINLTFYNDSSKYGGGLFITGSGADSIWNSIFWNDSAGTSGSEIYNTTSSGIILSYTLIRGGITGSEITGSGATTDGGGNIVADPLFVNPVSHDFNLTSSSPAINAGTNSAVTASNDLAGNPRISDDTVDMGAFEYQSAPLAVEMNSFTATVDQNRIELYWTTATEVNNYGFEIERKMVSGSMVQGSGTQTSNPESETWKALGFVQGAGTSSSPHQYSFVDADLVSGDYSYRIKQIDRDGSFSYSNEVQTEIETVPKKFELDQNYPNPFNPTTGIQYSVAGNQKVTLKVYNILGEEVATLVNEVKNAGTYNAMFNGSKLASGIYYYRLQSGNQVEMKKMMLIK
jgi:Secretion system C-terminal sorting domain